MGEKTTSIIIGTLVCLLGMASWIDINGLWVQFPLMVHFLPEGWNLASYVVIISQVANIGPLIFVLLSKFTKYHLEVPTNYLIIGIGAISCLMLAFFWDRTSYVNGVEHSTALFTLSFLLTLVDCTSSVSFLAFMYVFPMRYMTPYFIGEGLSGFVPALVGLMQGEGGNPECRNSSVLNETSNITTYELSYYKPPPRFSIDAFFFFLAAMLLCSFVAFAMLNNLPMCKREQAMKVDTDKNVQLIDRKFADKGDQVIGDSDYFDQSTQTIELDFEESASSKSKTKSSLTKCDWVYMLLLEAWVNAIMNTVMTSIQTYSTLPYGNVAYHLAVTLGLMANPTACVFVHFLPTRNNILIGFITFLGSCIGAYIMWTALGSPYPVLCGSIWGEVLVVLAWIFMVGLLTYVKVMIGVICRDNGRKALMWCGAAMQAGSLIGSIVIFPLVNVLYLFTPNDPCGDTCWN
ncbi:solute carrier family 52, riboflavin transporter, member 3-B-like [Saccoglossus kowalevskii]|uniref:Riboflavin transporter n=1 Tax=Saccoglossus kowalevskii TaxID=10224 RepID=A0ABM0LVL8_SACKO|nr:PREDICTED: solute carrier family 52, riboflavin transporter, member 3-B-like [Saccoglossus kowalevskii]